jgi:hypothetical protein
MRGREHLYQDCEGLFLERVVDSPEIDRSIVIIIFGVDVR